jgi:hypothetical protein
MEDAMSKPERMSEEAVVREATSRPNDPGHALRTWVAEARRARAEEERLRADLAQLQPSGQVAEDAKTLRMSWWSECEEGCGSDNHTDTCEVWGYEQALARLATGAQAVQEKDKVIAALADAMMNLLPPERGPGCWCHPAREVETAGHQPPCAIAREALRLAGRLP